MKKYKIVLDAGHSESTWETIHGKGVVYDGGKVFEEHWFNATVVKYAKELAEQVGIDVVLTQPLFSENEVSLGSRVNIARNENVDLLISFHADANGNRNAKGHWVFYWYTDGDSRKLAQLWDNYADQILPNPDRNIVESKQGSWTNFAMCREPVKYGIPSILIEHAFMTNAYDLKLLLDDNFRRKCAEVAIRAACEYLGVNFEIKNEQAKSVSTDTDKVETTIMMNGKIVAKGLIINNSTYVPLRSLGELLGAKITYNNSTKQAYVNNVPVTDSELIDGTTYVKLREFGEKLNVKFNWNNNTKTVTIIK